MAAGAGARAAAARAEARAVVLHVGVTSAVTAHLKSGHDNKLAQVQEI